MDTPGTTHVIPVLVNVYKFTVLNSTNQSHLMILTCHRFTKNLSPDKLQLSTLKGEGNLSDLELDENVLMQVLDLPTWLRLTKAVCNKLSVRVSIS